MIKKLLTATAAVLSLTLCLSAQAASDAGFPDGWKDWPITSKGKIPGASTPIPANVPPIVQETFKTYNWIGNGQGSAYNVRINPAQMNARAGKGSYKDAPTGVLELTDIGVILVTEHLLGEPQYGAFSVDGKDLSSAHPSLSPKVCTTCHSGYGEACINGVCTK